MNEKQSKKPITGKGGARPGSGRKKGTPNKLSMTVKENVIEVFQQIGGTTAMVTWAKDPKNQSEFYKIYTRLLPIEAQVSGVDGGAIEHVVKWANES
jgi:hypothetical protein